MTNAFIRRGKFVHRDTERRRPCEMETEIGVMHPETKESQGLLANARNWEKARKNLPSKDFKESVALTTPWFHTSSLRDFLRE